MTLIVVTLSLVIILLATFLVPFPHRRLSIELLNRIADAERMQAENERLMAEIEDVKMLYAATKEANEARTKHRKIYR